MKNLHFPVIATTLVLFFYLISVYTNVVFSIVFMLFLILNVLTVWMVIRILKDGEPSGRTFEEKWYEDGPSR